MPFIAGSLVLAASLAAPSRASVEERALEIAGKAGLAPAAAGVSAAVPAVGTAKPLGATAVFLSGGDFEGASPFDTGWLAGRCVNQAPWGGDGWGLNASSFKRAPADKGIEGVRLRVFDDGGNRVAGIFATESRGRTLAFARFVQGDAWGGTLCPANGRIGWRSPPPLPVAGRRLALKIDAKNEEARKFSNRLLRGGVGGTSHVMMAFNVWLTSPRLPKRAVLDLAVLHDCNWGVGECGPNTHEGDQAYHYIVHLSRDGKDSPKGKWNRWIVNLSSHILAAANRFGWDQSVRDSLSITQVEFLVEVMDAQGSVLFDNIHLVEVPPGAASQDRSLPFPIPDGADPLPIRR